MTDVARLLALRSFTELGARQRARALLDAGSFRELLAGKQESSTRKPAGRGGANAWHIRA